MPIMFPRRLSRFAVAALLGAALFSPVASAAEEVEEAVTFKALLEEMTDLDHLAEYPEPAYKTVQFSSYDRRSTDSAVLTDENWFANGDRGQYLRTEDHDGRREWVMVDVDGPGAVVRIWSANPMGKLRVYLDGETEPAIEHDMAELLGGKGPVPEPLAGVRGRGYNLYLPIPFAEHCKITSDNGDFYYTAAVRKYGDADVETFTMDDLEAGDLAGAGKAMAQAAAAEEMSVVSTEGRLAAGSVKRLNMNSSQAGAIRLITARVWPSDNATDEAVEAVMRNVVMKIEFDGQQTVEVPLGDFFGAAPGINPMQTLPISIDGDGNLTCRWVMPFQKQATITLLNLGEQAADVAVTAHSRQQAWTDQTMYFHAGYRSAYDVPMRPRSLRPHLNVEGEGVFVGTSLAVDNPTKAWWGEGDELITVDGEDFPSWFGTGSEDYFGYAWCDPNLFEHAFHAQPRCDGPQNYGRTSNVRFHVIDAIPFEKSFRFDMERWHWAEVSMNEATVAYWYAKPGATDDFEPLTAEELVVRPMPAWQPERVDGAIEGEAMTVVSKPEGSTVEQQTHGAAKSGEQLLWWHSPTVGDELKLTFNLDEGQAAGEYEIKAQCLNADDYGRFTISINGKSIDKPIDLYHNGSAIAGQTQSLGTFELKPRGNVMVVTVQERNTKALPENMFGLDYLLVESVD